jgi:hypothetical protein
MRPRPAQRSGVAGRARSLDAAAYLFLALDHMSRTVRGSALFTAGSDNHDDSQQVVDADQ